MSKRAIGSVFTAAAFMVGLSGPARAGTLIQRTTFTGSQAFTFFNASANVTCDDQTEGIVFASGALQAAETVQTGDFPFMFNGTLVSVQYFNSCTGMALNADGGVPNSLTPPDKKLTSAALVGSGTIQDFGTAQTLSVSFNVSIVGDGQINQQKSNTKQKIVASTGGPLVVTTSHSNNSNRSGTATGTISIGGVALNADFVFASMSINGSTNRTVTKL